MNDEFKDIPWADSSTQSTAIMPDGKALENVVNPEGVWISRVWKENPTSSKDIISREGGLQTREEAKECSYRIWKVSNGEKP